MRSTARSSLRLLLGVSSFALVAVPAPAFAQDSGTTAEEPAQPTAAGAETAPTDEVIVTGIRGSLQKSMNIKRNAQGVVDAISAEDIGKFPDTNLAESLQRITGVSIDRANGEGSKVTVRGFGPDFNLVLLNGRQMPASSLGDCCSAPASRSFDFANLASEGIAAVEVYKSGRATLPTGGIGSTINIRTPRPLDRKGLQGSIGVKGVLDLSREGDLTPTPEISGIISKTFADDTVGILVSGSYQRRKASLAQFNAGWREGYLGDENNWGSLSMDPNAPIENRPGPTDIYQVPQNAGYDFTDIDRKRYNAQAVLQVRPTDNLSAVLDYTFSQNTLKARTSSIGVWFNHGATSSSWTDGPVAGPNFYSETFGPGKDLAITGAVAANRSVNHSIGGNVAWDGPSGFRLELDAHHSTAESKPTSPYGSNIAVGSAIFGVESQTVDFTSDMPVISVDMFPGSEITAGNIRPAGNAFRNAYMKDRINEASLRGGYDFDAPFIDSLDFGVTYTDHKLRSAYGFIQNDTWGGTLSADETPDDLFQLVGLPNALSGMSGSNDPSIIPNYFRVDTEGLIDLLQSELGICDSAIDPGTCISEFRVDRRIKERTWAPYIQSTHTFDLFDNPANLRLGLRYETTKVNSDGLTPVPTGTIWAAENEIALQYEDETTITKLKGKYHNWLPAIDFDMSPISNVKLRASYSHTITRADYASLQGGLTLNSPARPNGGSTGAIGNPGLIPYKSKNFDLSAEWYYGLSSYVSVGWFHKTVSNFIANTNYVDTPFNLPNPAQGAAANAARAALGPNATYAQIVGYVQANFPALYVPPSGGPLGSIRGAPGDPAIPFTISQTDNSDQTAKLNGWEFAVQHNFWDTGFGAILNYTIVNSNQKYDNELRYTATQFAVTGVSDSANAVLYYDKNGLQARVAYNWREGYLSGYGFDPFYIEDYGQWDVSASYEFRKNMTVFVEGINVTKEDRRGHMRANQAVFFAAPGYARYAAGLRVGF